MYPYRITLNAKGYGDGDTKLRKLYDSAHLLNAYIMSQFPEVNNKSVMRVSIHKQKIMLYIATYDVFAQMVTAWPDRVIEINGPISQHHIELLLDSECKVQLVNHPWYHLFNLRVVVTGPSHLANFWAFSQAMKQNLENCKCVNINHSAGVFWYSIYTDYDEFMAYRGLFSLAYPGTTLEMTRCFVVDDKYLS